MNESSDPPDAADAADAQSPHPSNDAALPNYAFLVHSQQTLPRNLPPNVDNKSLARQKRRRTSPEDQAILETEYSRNPKPDKSVRQEIVQRVALGDKEVQIWFQNRRQNDRRKSRPLLPQDLVPRGLLPNVSDSEVADALYAQDDKQDENKIESQLEIEDLEDPHSTQIEAAEHVGSSQDTVGSTLNIASMSSQISHETAPTATSSYYSQPAGSSNGRLPSTGYLANRRSASFQRSNSGPFIGEEIERISSDTRPLRNPSLKKSSSAVRISLTSDGNAKILTNEDSSPSPPRPASATAEANSIRGRLSRSQSATGLGQSATRTEVEPFMDIRPRGAPGRSRDSRAWEFWCDSDARNALAEKANQDAGGSAADAIGLMRSNSKNALGSNTNKRNAQMLRRDSVKRLKSGSSGQPKLSRTTSELAQGKMKEAHGTKNKTTHAGDIEIPNNESDKENWEPDQQTQPSGQSKASYLAKNEKTTRKILGESNNIPSKNSSFGAMMAREKGRKPSKIHLDAENTNPEDDPEIAEFMGTSRKASSSTNAMGEDFDCVQGLLSLSQGNWR